MLFCYNIEIDMLVQNTVREQAHLMLSNFQIVFKKQNILKHFVPTWSKTLNYFEFDEKVNFSLTVFWTSSRIDITKSMQLSLRNISLIKTKTNIAKLVIQLQIAFCIFIFIIQNYFDYSEITIIVRRHSDITWICKLSFSAVGSKSGF